jgi:hypothetical protein
MLPEYEQTFKFVAPNDRGPFPYMDPVMARVDIAILLYRPILAI